MACQLETSFCVPTAHGVGPCQSGAERFPNMTNHTDVGRSVTSAACLTRCSKNICGLNIRKEKERERQREKDRVRERGRERERRRNSEHLSKPECFVCYGTDSLCMRFMALHFFFPTDHESLMCVPQHWGGVGTNINSRQTKRGAHIVSQKEEGDKSLKVELVYWFGDE